MTRDHIDQPTMSPAEFRRAQQRLGLSDFQFAKMLGLMHAQHIRRLKAEPDKAHHRPITGTVIRLIVAYLSGYRPADWPRKDPNP